MTTPVPTLCRQIEQRRRRGEAVALICRDLRIHPSTYYRWRKIRAEAVAGHAAPRSFFAPIARASEHELHVLRAAWRALPREQRRQAADWAEARFNASQRLTARGFGIARRREPVESDERAIDRFTDRLLQLARENPSFGYRRVWALLRREGWLVNHKRVHRLWRAHSLNQRVAVRRRRRPHAPSIPAPAAATPHECWSLDATRWRRVDGRPVEFLLVLDEYSRFCLALDAYPKVDAAAARTTLQRLFDQGSVPLRLRLDGGMLKLLRDGPELLAYIRVDCAKGKSPARNPFAESFIARLREECPCDGGLVDLRHAQLVADRHRDNYNTHRPHSGIGYRTPTEMLEVDEQDEP